MTQDLLAGRYLEVDEVFGDLVDRADRVAVDVPRLRLVLDLLRGTSELQANPAVERVMARP
jgi:ketopantoate reductase